MKKKPRKTRPAAEIELESDAEERRFFSQPPPAYDEAFDEWGPASFAPTTQAANEARSKREARAEAARFSARRAKLRRRVIATLCAAVSLLMVGLVVQSRAEAQRRLVDPPPRSSAAPVAAAGGMLPKW